MTDNKLIAEFMGYQVVDSPKVINGENFFEYLDKNGVYTYCDSLLRYNDKWDWLMPVVAKCTELNDDEFDNQSIAWALLSDSIVDVYDHVVEFIKEYKDEL